uniref:Uncharacterized protein n=1 Tax=Magallana gigas TaxID=29159 RepID=A0A8W8NW74_MAGGI
MSHLQSVPAVTNTDPAPKKTLAADADDNADHYVTRTPQFTICLTPSPNGRLMLVIPVTLTISASSQPGTQSLATANTQPITTRDVPLGSDPIDKTDNPWTINYEFLAILLMQIVRIKRLSPSKLFPEFFKDSENGKDISMDN